MDSCSYCSKHIVNSPPAPNGACKPGCLLLEDKQVYHDRKSLWQSKTWDQKDQVVEVRHKSMPYHGGCPTLVSPLELETIGNPPRNLASPMDEIVFYWTTFRNDKLLNALESPVNSAYYLLKFLAYSWNNQLEFIGCSVANSEWFADDHEAKVDNRYSPTDWKDELIATAEATKDIQFMRRKMGHFESAMTLSLERLGVPFNTSPSTDTGSPLPTALVEAQQDFLSMSQRLQPFRQRIDDLSSIATGVAGLQVAFKSIRDSEQGLWLSVFAAIIFPLTLVASIFSMSDSYLPGAGEHWVFWATSVPLAFIVSVALMYGRGSEKHAREAWHRIANRKIRRKNRDPECA